MKLLLGSAAAAGMLVAATAANAQALSSYLVDEPVAIVSGVSAAATRVLTAATNVGARMLPPYGPAATTVVVSDMEGSYPVASPEPPPRYVSPGAARYVPPVLSPRDIDAIARDSGFSPLGAPQQRGFVYTMSAINPNGEDGRLVFDARNGRILRFMPAYRMGDRMSEEIVTTYGPVGPPASLPEGRPDYRSEPHSEYRPDYRGTPRPPAPSPRVASRTPNVPLPKSAPPRAVAALPKPVAAVPAAVPAPAEQSASVETKPAETTGTAPATPTVGTAPVEANPSEAKLSAAPASETKPSEANASETKASETKASETKASETKPSTDTKPETVAAVPAETNASETQSADNKSSADAKPATAAKPATSEIQATKPMPPVQGLE